MSLDLVDQLGVMPVDQRREYFRRLDQRQRSTVLGMIEERRTNPFFRFRDDPVAFMTHDQGLGETAWSLQKEILESIRDHPKTAVPACHAPGKTHIAARAIAWWGSVHPAGSARVLTTATSFRQVKNILWPYLRKTHAQHSLPGRMNLTEWRIGPQLDILAEGVKPPDEDEHALSGLHAPHVLIVVDEAGGISRAFGQTLIGLLTGSHTRLLVIGNPPVDEEGSWFEQQCEDPTFNVIRIPASRTPNWTGEDAGLCKAHPEMGPHPISDHLVDKAWAADLSRSFGEDSAVVMARRDAQFPKNNESKAVPLMWLEACLADDEDGPDPRRKPGQVKLGVDIAAGGTDEFVIAQLDGNVVTILHRSAGAVNTQPGYVEGKVREYALAAAELHRARGISQPVRVKVDTVGVGWGIYQGLEAKQAKAGDRLDGVLYVDVQAGASAKDTTHFRRQRDEGWWALREAVQADATGRRELVLDFGGDEQKRQRILAQLNAPRYTQDSTGHTVVESKDKMQERGVSSPDVADAVWQALYEPREVVWFPGIGPQDVGGTPEPIAAAQAAAPAFNFG